MTMNLRRLVPDPAGPIGDNEQLLITPEVRQALIYLGWIPPGGPECTEGAPGMDIEGIPDPHAGCPCVLKLGHENDAFHRRHKCRCGSYWPRVELPAHLRRPPSGEYRVLGEDE